MPNGLRDCNRLGPAAVSHFAVGAIKANGLDPPCPVAPRNLALRTEPDDWTICKAKAMPATPADLFARLDRLGIAYTTVSHPPLFTVEQSRALRGSIPGGHTKNLFLRDKRGAYYLVVALEDAVIDLKSLAGKIGASGRLSFGSAQAMGVLLGVAPGAVTPFGVMNDHGGRVTAVLDAAMLAQEVLNYHPLVNTMTTTISPNGLLEFLTSTGHEPRVAAVAAEPLAPP